MIYKISKSIITGNPLLKIFISFICFIIFTALFGLKDNAISSFISLSLCGLLSLVILGYSLRKYFGQNVLFYISLFYLIKLVIGYIHWELFVHPNYFEQPYNIIFDEEYVWMHNSSTRIYEYRLENGYFSDVIFDYSLALDFNKGFFIFLLVSEIYYWVGAYALNISIINTLFTFYSAFIIGIITFHFFHDRKKARFAFALVVFQGMTLIPSVMMRDVIGQGLIAFSVLWAYQVKNSILKSFIILPITTFFFFTQRSMYAIIPTVVNAFQLIFNKSNYSFVLRLLFFLILLLIFPQLVQIFEFNNNLSNTNENYSFIRNPLFFLTFPLQLIKGLIGVFPWYQYFQVYNEFNGKAYYPMEFIQSIMNIVMIYFIVILIYFKKFDFTSIQLTGFSLVLFGILSGYLHTSYISIGFIFFIPTLTIFNRRKWFVTFCVVLIFYIIANFVYFIFGLDGTDPTGFFRFDKFQE